MSDYPVLDNRPINKWKVAELREELKRRNLTTKGLKDDLVRRLNEDMCKEMEAAEVEESKDDDRDIDPANGLEDTEPEPDPVKLVDEVLDHPQSEVTKGSDHITDSACGLEDTQPNSSPAKLVDNVQKHHQDEVNDIDGDDTRASTKNCLVEIEQNKVLDEVATGGTDAAAGESRHSEAPVHSTSVINKIASTDQFIEDKPDKEHKVIDSSQDNYVVDGVSGVQDVSIPGSCTGQDAEDMKISSSEGVLEDNLRRQENDVEVTPVTSSIKLDNEGLKPSGMDAEPDMSNPATQVYEVNPNLGSQVKSDSFSTDTLPINENKDLNDNLNADNVKLETEVVRQEMELQSSSKDLSDVGSSHPLDDQMPHEMQGLVGETDDDESSDVKFSMKNDNADQVSVDVAKVEHGLESKTSNNSEQTDIQFDNARTLGDVVEPSLSPKNIEGSAEDKHGLTASGDDRKDFSKINDLGDGENMEKINLDQSDDSMEEDVLETKHVDFDHISKENDKTEEPITVMTEDPKVRLSGSSDAMQLDIPSEKVESQETKDKSPDLSEKRKFQDEAGGGSKEPAKRQRRWNTESLKTAEPQNSSVALSKNVVQTTPVKPILGRTNSTVGGDAPKERIVPKSSETATNSLKIENFLRPFTLKAVQELLGRTGEVCSFWMDQIKTHCYVTYSSVEEAIETRNAVYNLQWPPNGGRLLVADFVDPQQVQTKVEGREPAFPPKNASPAVPPASSSVQTPPAQQQGRKQQAESEHPLARQPAPAPPSAPPTKEMLPSPVADKNDPPIVTLDDLFRKTKATPRIYYLPLTDEEVAKKLAIRGNAKH
ncbi:uncharacterized protein LOC132627471 [Lycium barbarum]|uniref:uncharacterized protein LOC132627471 n=1 Tax=Lycium barbarum TaxID=112863 RepID=UPI00293EBD55|nr:uncharacterized protein LOC132627471 [Lycium barbarum]XP_060198817.1 uncharacterized protein LOC132627471 [Lycium barbarum]XP_060198818.1 uncharacterized protein LOC132627471 [Lycium barbarum]